MIIRAAHGASRPDRAARRTLFQRPQQAATITVGVVSSDDDHAARAAVPARWSSAPDAAAAHSTVPALTEVVRDGARWTLGTVAEVAWIAAGATADATVTSAIPPVFEAYASIALPEGGAGQERHDEAVMTVLSAHSARQPWWLGYLDTGADDVVFPDAPRVRLYGDWPYVLVQAGPEQATAWRSWDRGASFWSGHLPNLMFPADRCWLVSTLWDDDWTCVGGSAALVDDLVRHPDLRSRARQVELGEDATPPGLQAR